MEVLVTLIIIVFGVLQIILFFKLWGMTNDVSALRKKLAPATDEPQKQQNLLGMYVRIRATGKQVRVVARESNQYKCVDVKTNEPCGEYSYNELEALG